MSLTSGGVSLGLVRRILITVLLLLALLLPGCAEKTRELIAFDAEDLGLEWPGAPEPARVRWIAEVGDYKDIGLSRGFWGNLGSFLFGSAEKRIVGPYGIHFDVQQRLLVADPVLSSVHLMDLKSGRYSLLRGSDKFSLVSPIGLASDSEGAFYLTDSVSGMLFRYDPQKKELSQFGTAKLVRPTGIAFNAQNWLLYVSDTAVHQIVAIGLDGLERFRFGYRGDGLGGLNYPTDLWVDRVGKVFVTDSLNARVQIFSPDGEPRRSVGTRGHSAGYLDKPKGVATDSDGNIYVVDTLKDAVLVYDGDGRFLFQFGDRGQGPGQFWMPAGIFIDNEDKIYVSDTYNRRIQIFQHLKD